jgi:hypothetical protein
MTEASEPKDTLDAATITVGAVNGPGDDAPRSAPDGLAEAAMREPPRELVDLMR